MDYFKAIEKMIREENGVSGMKLRIEVLKPEYDGVREYLQDENGDEPQISYADYILKHIEYIDEMVKYGYTEFENNEDVLRERWSPINQIVENEENQKFYCYFTHDGKSCDWEDVESYVENEFECDGFCAESFHVSHDEFNDIFSNKPKSVQVDFIGIAEEDMEEGLDIIKTYTINNHNK